MKIVSDTMMPPYSNFKNFHVSVRIVYYIKYINIYKIKVYKGPKSKILKCFNFECLEFFAIKKVSKI